MLFFPGLGLKHTACRMLGRPATPPLERLGLKGARPAGAGSNPLPLRAILHF